MSAPCFLLLIDASAHSALFLRVRGNLLESAAGSVLLRLFLAVSRAFAHDLARHAHAKVNSLAWSGPDSETSS